MKSSTRVRSIKKKKKKNVHANCDKGNWPIGTNWHGIKTFPAIFLLSGLQNIALVHSVLREKHPQLQQSCVSVYSLQ